VDMRRSDRADPSPFLRRGQSMHVRRSRRRRSARRLLLGALSLTTLGALLGVAYVGRHYAMHSPRFALRWIDLTPTVHASPETLRHAVQRYRGRNLFRLDLERIEREMEEIPWVEDARVKRVLPNGLLCSIEERVPRGLALLDGRVWLVDGRGAAIDAYGEATRMYSFPIFTGIDTGDGDRVREQIGRGLRLLDFLRATRTGLVSDVSEIDLSRNDRISLRLNGGGPVVRLNPDDYGTNLESYLAMRDYLGTHFGDGAYVDLRFRDRIALQPRVARGH
jgi:cell division septal protein FtsQ